MQAKTKTVQPTKTLFDSLYDVLELTALVHDLNPLSSDKWLSYNNNSGRTANRFTAYSGHSTAQYGTDNSLTLG